MGRQPTVNRRGVAVLGALALCMLSFLQVIEDGGSTPPAVAKVLSRMGDDGPSGRLAQVLEDDTFGVVEIVDEQGETAEHIGGSRDENFGSSFGDGVVKEWLAQPVQRGNLTEFVLLMKASPAEIPMVLTYASYGYKDTLMNWIVSVEKQNVESWGVVCLDAELKQYLALRGIPCYFVDTAAMSDPSSSQSPASADSKVQNIGRLWILRLNHLSELLEAGVSVVLSDSDAVWVRNPIRDGLLGERTGDIVLSRGKFPFELTEKWGATACMGLAYFRSTRRVQNLVARARKEGVTAKDDQVGVNRALFQSFGLDPVAVFGRKVELYGDVDEVAPATKELPRFVLLSHSHVPRFCSKLDRSDWNSVYVAHCHARDGVVAKTYKNWGNAKTRNNIMSKYNLWCSEADKSPNNESGFLTWLQRATKKCSFGR